MPLLLNDVVQKCPLQPDRPSPARILLVNKLAIFVSHFDLFDAKKVMFSNLFLCVFVKNASQRRICGDSRARRETASTRHLVTHPARNVCVCTEFVCGTATFRATTSSASCLTCAIAALKTCKHSNAHWVACVVLFVSHPHSKINDNRFSGSLHQFTNLRNARIMSAVFARVSSHLLRMLGHALGSVVVVMHRTTTLTANCRANWLICKVSPACKHATSCVRC